MASQEAKEIAQAIFGGNGDFYSFRKKPKTSSQTVVNNSTIKSIGFTESQINTIIEKAKGKNIQFYINKKEFYYLNRDKVVIENELFYAFNSEINAVKVYPLSAIEHITIFEKKK